MKKPSFGIDSDPQGPYLAVMPRILFDESHSQAWTTRPEVAAQIQPSHPADSSYALAADAARSRGLDFAAHTEGELTPEVLAAADVLVIAHPSDPEWEAVVPGGSPVFSAAELDAIEAFVAAGGGLLLLGEEEQAKYGSNVAQLAERFSFAIDNRTVSDYERHHSAPHWVLADLEHPRGGVDLMARVEDACFYRATTVQGGTAVARASGSSSAPGESLMAAGVYGTGRVAVLGDSDIFGDDCIVEFDHASLWTDLLHWLAAVAFARPLEHPEAAAAADPAWGRLKAATDALRPLQAADGSSEDAMAAELAGQMAAAVLDLKRHFPHQEAYLDALAADLRAWVAGGCAKPDFRASLELFRPELGREDGATHLVVFPMYLQNSGSRDTHFEALIVRGPWPGWLAELEGTRYDNPKFVPVTFVDHTAGYDSECAVLFPETVSIEGDAINNFGGIFCDREAARFRAKVSQAAEILSLNLPADAAALLQSESLSQDAYMLWDLVHDRAHSHGDLPFDPFMIRQRMPYWMYSLEELRCDLTAFGEAVELEREGLALARHVQYAILFDRLFRFPVTGARVRNYDGLGGQLLFAYLHKHGHVHWTDNRLTIEWGTVAQGVTALREEVQELYRSGIDRSKVQQWIAAHELVSEYVPAAASSKWAAGRRALDNESDPKAWIELVEPDEFPLSMFYTQLKAKLDAPPAVAA
jgi:hypothetical protein